MAETSQSFDAFKAPFLDETIDPPAEDKESSEDTSSGKGNTVLEVAAQKPKKKANKTLINVPLPYKEPDWGGPPPSSYNFEIIKNGTLISTVAIRSSFLVFGRLEVCDFVFEHPSVSRYHAIVQYCKGDDSHPMGFYLYDLGSTHGTFLNKEAIKPKIYYKLKVGYILKFGGSSRLHIFQGPEEEEIVETKKPEVENKAEEEVCSWGMGEDAPEEEEETVNPFALSTPNEELYLEDPKKTLRGWFEREGYEVEYNVEEKGFKTFACCVRLPVDTPSGDFLTVEASVSGKKKEAVIACALEACRTLDRLGLLRQSHHESRQRKKKKWEENDYYDSDEDTFYDRTGEIEKRREMRKRLAKKTGAENFESIEIKLKVLVEEISGIEAKLAACAAKDSLSSKNEDDDSLEMYMSSLAKSANAPTDKFEKRRLKLRLVEAEKERTYLEKLLNIARPTKLPPVVKHPGIIGKRLKSKLQLPVVKPKQPVKSEDTNEEEIEEMESDTETNVSENISKVSDVEASQIKDNTMENRGGKYGLQLKVTCESDKIKDSEASKAESTTNSERGISQPITVFENSDKKESDEKMDFEQIPLSVKSAKRNSSKRHKKEVDVYKTETTEYCTWTPPSNQSGDGMTHLNQKFGY